MHDDPYKMFCILYKLFDTVINIMLPVNGKFIHNIHRRVHFVIKTGFLAIDVDALLQLVVYTRMMRCNVPLLVDLNEFSSIVL